MKKVIALLASFIVALLGYVMQDHWARQSLQKHLIEHRYSEVFVNGKGQIIASDPRITPQNIERYRLPLAYEVYDKQLVRYMMTVEGYGILAKTKGLIKGALSMIGVGHYGGGSTLDVSSAGSMLSQRVAQPDFIGRVFNRGKEMALARVINELDEAQRDVIMLNEVCMYNNVTGCTLVASALWGRPAKTAKERIILISSIRYPITEDNAERLVDYSTVQCNRLRKVYDEIAQNDCYFTSSDFKTKATVKYPSVLHQHLMGANHLSLDNKLFAIEQMSKIKNADVEISLKDATTGELVLLISNSSKIMQNGGFDETYNIASVAKLITLLDIQAHYPQGMVQAMAKSNNDAILKLAHQSTSGLSLERYMMQAGITFNYSDLLVDSAKGRVNGSSDNIHHLLSTLIANKPKMTSINQQALSSATSKDGTLRYVQQFVKKTDIDVVVAKSGTVAVRQNSGEKGVYGNLAVYGLKSPNQKNYTLVIRVHAKNNKPICQAEGCGHANMMRLTDLAFGLLPKA
ncbi:hypothetical protein LP123_13970 [Moraxella bovis]|uniref:Uncharacterized protein n=1 Tax=Moraxella bovis TaxID=476 RepID=A0AAQ2Q8Q9_MORBO|nr:hypothetical protein [Moraxella bovis]AWY19116.1 hypothetical protein DQF64_00315 [Moraxella bovis]OOR88600.1 hypothetical protein B0182_09770 [Moraxella bovis]UYZ75825.1 hypothetical protein LP093_00335 [Moraxella bovis]UYZ78234.1 hypothetical protein LP115_13520 [Moraxella bovis]UYZ81120.1 hypothetical protein LP113_14150 [Moraxella bovis]